MTKSPPRLSNGLTVGKRLANADQGGDGVLPQILRILEGIIKIPVANPKLIPPIDKVAMHAVKETVERSGHGLHLLRLEVVELPQGVAAKGLDVSIQSPQYLL